MGARGTETDDHREPSCSFRTIDLARASSSHPNTVRLYEDWGFLSPPLRGPNGYRRWTEDHLDQMIFARRALDGFWPGRPIRKSAIALVKLAATGDLVGALAHARGHVELVRRERERADAAAACLDAWAAAAARLGKNTPSGPRPYSYREAASFAEVTPGQLRNWERNGLLAPFRAERSGRRAYGDAEIGRARVIRALLLAGYSMMAVRRMTAEFDRGRSNSLSSVLDTPRPDEEVLTAFDKWRSFLDAQLARAEDLASLLAARLAKRTPGTC